MAEKNSQKIPGLDRLEDELFINNDSSSIDSTDIDDEFDRLLNEFINNELKDVETPEPKPAAPQTKPQPSKAKNQAPAISEKLPTGSFTSSLPMRKLFLISNSRSLPGILPRLRQCRPNRLF